MTKSARIARSGPVHFQSLESELAPLSEYIRGEVLNAGCGERDLSSWLAAQGASGTVSFDIASSLPTAVIGPLERLPFGSGRFDTVICNAVLEHVIDVQMVMSELVRVLRPGGHAIITVPFLQPFHACPTDFRRYTRDGLIALGADAGLEVIEIRPVHSAAQSIGWILWEIAKEKGPMMRTWVWPLIFLWTRLSLRSDPSIRQNANAFQIAFRHREAA